MNLYLVRHAHAGHRGLSSGADFGRSLSEKGRDQAGRIADALDDRPLVRVVSSPLVRCVETAAVTAARHGLPVEADPRFAEGQDPAAARLALDELANGEGDVVVCTHGDLLPDMLDQLEREGVALEGRGCAKGSLWHLIVDDGRIERAVYYPAPAAGVLPAL